MTPRIIGVCLSWPRASLAQVLGCWARQSYPAELFVFTDQSAPTMGQKRNAAVRGAIAHADLGPDDWMVVIDDDDHYAPWHVATLAAAIEERPQAGVIAPPCYLSTDHRGAIRVAPMLRGAPAGVTVIDPGAGPHAGDALRVGAWALCGGYDDYPEDRPLLERARNRLGVHYAQRASYVHRQDRGDHRGLGHLQPRDGLSDVPPPDRHYSATQRRWDALLAQL